MRCGVRLGVWGLIREDGGRGERWSSSAFIADSLVLVLTSYMAYASLTPKTVKPKPYVQTTWERSRKFDSWVRG